LLLTFIIKPTVAPVAIIAAPATVPPTNPVKKPLTPPS